MRPSCSCKRSLPSARRIPWPNAPVSSFSHTHFVSADGVPSCSLSTAAEGSPKRCQRRPGCGGRWPRSWGSIPHRRFADSRSRSCGRMPPCRRRRPIFPSSPARRRLRTRMLRLPSLLPSGDAPQTPMPVRRLSAGTTFYLSWTPRWRRPSPGMAGFSFCRRPRVSVSPASCRRSRSASSLTVGPFCVGTASALTPPRPCGPGSASSAGSWAASIRRQKPMPTATRWRSAGRRGQRFWFCRPTCR